MLADRLRRPFREFLDEESASAALIAVAVVAALVWVNAGGAEAYHHLFARDIHLAAGDWAPHLDVLGWINDGLMALFFLVVGLEIKRELVQGELSSPRQAALPALAALGGMVVPALLFLAVTAGTGQTRGWGIPMATDIALAAGVVTALGSRLPTGAKVFLLALAIVDDIGAIIVIALVYSSGVRWGYLAGAVACAVAVAALARTRPGLTPVFVVLGLAMWWLTLKSGVHATIAAVTMGLLTPATPLSGRGEVEQGSTSRIEWLEHLLHPWTSLLIVPLFAFANAGLVIDRASVSGAIHSRVALGVMLGLIIGKPVGIMAAVLLGRRLGLQPPDGTTTRVLGALAVTAGIGFTVSIFVADLALPATETAEAKLAVLAASLVAAAAGAISLRAASRRRPLGEFGSDQLLDE